MPPPNASDAAATDPHERFRRDLTAALGRAIGDGERLALAVSGGPDSMAMLWLAAAAFPGQIVAATVDHRLRPASADEAAVVAGWCAGQGVAHRTLRVAAPKGASGNLHAWARQQRYALLGDWANGEGATCLLTAHHADDQAETFLMRAARGAGLSGLAGIRPRAYHGTSTVRPLLGWRRAELVALAAAAALPVAYDPSNADPRFERARLRTWLAIAPEGFDVAGIARAAGHLAQVEEDVRAITMMLMCQRALPSPAGECLIDVADLPREVRRRLAREAIASVGIVTGTTPFANEEQARTGSIESLLDALEAGGQAMQKNVLACADGTIWRFRKAPPRRTA